MSQAQLVLIVPISELGGIAGTLPSFGGGAGDPGYGKPIFHPGHPDHGLPSHGHADQGLPSHGHISGGPVVPPNVKWPPSFTGRPDNSLPPELVRPSNPIVLPEGEPLPEGSAFVAVYTTDKGWKATVIKGSGAQPK